MFEPRFALNSAFFALFCRVIKFVLPIKSALLLQNVIFKLAQRFTVKLGDKGRFDKEQIGVKEPFPVAN